METASPVWGGDARQPTDSELAFVSRLVSRVPQLDLWLHLDAQGPWLCVSRDVLRPGGGIDVTLRLDFDGERILGGVSPASLNWDGGVRAERAGISGSEDGEVVFVGELPGLADAAAEWFLCRLEGLQA